MNNDVFAFGIWGVLTPGGVELAEGTQAATGYSARSNMTHEHHLVWSQRLEQGYSLAKLVPRVVQQKPFAAPVERTGVTGAVFTYSAPGQAAVKTSASSVVFSKEDRAVIQTLEAVELALTEAGFDITNEDLRDVLTTARDAIAKR